MQNTLHNTFPVPHNVLEDEKFKKYNASIKFVFVFFCKLHNRLANDEGWFFHSGKNSSKEAGVNMKTFGSAKKKLKADGYIDVKQGKYNPDKNTRHACWYKVNGFLNKGVKPETPKENQPANPQEKGFVTKKALEVKFGRGKGGEIFAWAIETNLLERLSDTEGRVIATEGQIRVAVGKAYAGIYDGLTKFLLTQMRGNLP